MKLEDGEIDEHAGAVKDTGVEGVDSANQSDMKPSSLQQSGWSRRDGHQKAANMVDLMLFLILLNCIDVELCMFNILIVVLFFRIMRHQ